MHRHSTYNTYTSTRAPKRASECVGMRAKMWRNEKWKKIKNAHRHTPCCRCKFNRGLNPCYQGQKSVRCTFWFCRKCNKLSIWYDAFYDRIVLVSCVHTYTRMHVCVWVYVSMSVSEINVWTYFPRDARLNPFTYTHQPRELKVNEDREKSE